MRTNIIIVVASILITSCYVSANAASIHSLYNDRKALSADDILTVVIVESAKAGSESGTNTSKQNDMNVSGANGSGLLKFLPSFGASAGSKVDYDGKAGTSREGSLDAKVSARVIKVLDNGNLVIDGSKVVEINDEKEIIKVSGVVRPQDIESNNIVYSYNIADAQITYSGKGACHTGQRPGLIARFINWIF
jgi:flagellar L-ring protein FlgH